MRNLASRYGTLIFVAVALTTSLGTPAWGHAALQDSDPRQGARLEAVPPSVIVTYAEPPTNESVFQVFDGCDRDVASDVTILNDMIEAATDSGEPGRWRVEWRVISAVDGHLTSDRVAFQVAGRADCSDVATDVPGEAVDEGGGLPLVPISIATIVILAAATIVRLLTRKPTGGSDV